RSLFSTLFARINTMAVTTVAQFATELNRPAATLLEQLKSAGVHKASHDDVLTEADKERLLDHLRHAHGSAGADRKKITLTRKSTTEIKQADASGKARTIQVEVRKKRVFVKRDDVASEEAVPEIDDAELQRREELARHEAEALRQQEEALAEQRRQREELERAERAERLAAEERALAVAKAESEQSQQVSDAASSAVERRAVREAAARAESA